LSNLKFVQPLTDELQYISIATWMVRRLCR